MTSNIQIVGLDLEDALIHIDALTDTVRAQTRATADSLRDAADELADLPPCCTGTAYWRDNQGTRLLYANHGINRSCPIHGEPESGKRLRSYIGADPDAQKDALAAIARTVTVNTLQEQIRTRKGALQSAERVLRTILHAYKHPTRAPWLF